MMENNSTTHSNKFKFEIILISITPIVLVTVFASLLIFNRSNNQETESVSASQKFSTVLTDYLPNITTSTDYQLEGRINKSDSVVADQSSNTDNYELRIDHKINTNNCFELKGKWAENGLKATELKPLCDNQSSNYRLVFNDSPVILPRQLTDTQSWNDSYDTPVSSLINGNNCTGQNRLIMSVKPDIYDTSKLIWTIENLIAWDDVSICPDPVTISTQEFTLIQNSPITGTSSQTFGIESIKSKVDQQSNEFAFDGWYLRNNKQGYIINSPLDSSNQYSSVTKNVIYPPKFGIADTINKVEYFLNDNFYSFSTESPYCLQPKIDNICPSDVIRDVVSGKNRLVMVATNQSEERYIRTTDFQSAN